MSTWNGGRGFSAFISRRKPGAPLELGAADPVVDVDVGRVDGPALARRVGRRVLDLPGDALLVVGEVLVGRLAGVDGGDHSYPFSFGLITETMGHIGTSCAGRTSLRFRYKPYDWFVFGRHYATLVRPTIAPPHHRGSVFWSPQGGAFASSIRLSDPGLHVTADRKCDRLWPLIELRRRANQQTALVIRENDLIPAVA